MVAGTSQAAAAKVGGTCKKSGTKSGTKAKPLVCSKTSKGLRWTAVKKASTTETTVAKTKAADTTVVKSAETTVAKPKAADTTVVKAKPADTTIVKK
jgi:hypothetical protein